MKYSDFHLYTVVKGKRFIDAALICAQSFVSKNPGLKFTIFIFDALGGHDTKDITIKHVECPEYFTPAMLKKKPCADILFFKYADAPFMLDTDAKYIGQIDADSLCMCKLPFQYFTEDLGDGKFCAASDPKVEINKREITKGWPRGFKWELYFNSGVCFWRNDYTNQILQSYKKFVLDYIDDLSNFKYADQTWMNIFMNAYPPIHLSEIGWYWNYRGTTRHNRAYIWHAGGRDSEGIEVLKKEFESWI